MILPHRIFALLLCVISTCNGYRILAIFPFSGRSHFNVLEQVAKALAQKGHRVDVMSNFKLKEPFPNYTELEFPSDPQAEMEYKVMTSLELERQWVVKHKSRQCDLLGHPKISQLIKNPPNDPPYDAVLVHMLLGYQCFSAIGYVWDVPVIGVATTMLYAQHQQMIGNPMSLAIAPGHVNHYKEKFNFWDRVYNVWNTHQFLRMFHRYAPLQNYYIKKHLGADMPDYLELQKNIALMLSNSHYSFHGIKPKTPAVVEIGGINIKNDTTELSPDLKKLLDESKSGFIYFSFGSITVLESLPPDVFQKFFEAIRKIAPIRVVMRATNPQNLPKNIPNNVYPFKWLPQQQILQHPNIKAFITHGGGLSAQETIHHAVPVICLPLFSEQRLNCDIFTVKNMGVKINPESSQEIYDEAFQKVLSNSTYKESMRKFSALFWDRPQSPHEAVNYWVEYVIRHGKNVLRSPAVDLELWQSELIDVYCFLFSCFLLSIVITLILIHYAVKFVLRRISLRVVTKMSKKSN